MYSFVKPRGMWTGLMTAYGSGRPNARHQDRVLVGRQAVLDDRPLADRLEERGPEPARTNPSSRPSAAVVLPRFWPVAAR